MSNFLKGKKVLVTGGKGFLGSALVKKLEKTDCNQIITFSSKEYDLRDINAVRQLLSLYKPDIIIHLAAKVGGIGANKEKPGDFFFDNLLMGIQLIDEARKIGVQKFVTVGTTCSYPKYTRVPFVEEDLWNGYPEETNAPYGLAKKMLLVQSEAYKKQYGFNSIYLIPTNLYGPNDNFNPNTSHVIPALIKKFVDAKQLGNKTVKTWGSGKATREFIFVDDAAEGIIKATEIYNETQPINIGTGSEVSIKDLVEEISNIVGYEGEIIWDISKPEGQPRRCLDISKAKEKFGFIALTTLYDGLQKTADWYKQNV